MTHHKHSKCQALCPACEIGPFIRNHYFNGKLLLERDFTDEQRYQIEKLRHHHLRLHGWGVVCGLKIKPHENQACRGRFICIEPGTAIDCCGHEIVVREEECIDITRLPLIKDLFDKKDKNKHDLQICLRYRECPTEEIPVLYDECGCDDTKCAPNRILESYDVDVIVRPLAPQDPTGEPKLTWKDNVTLLADVSRVAVYDPGKRMYLLVGDDVFVVDTAVQPVVGPNFHLAAKGLEIVVSNDGEHLFVVTEPPSDPTTNERQMVVLQTSDMKSLYAPFDLQDSIGSDVRLVVASDNQLIALVGTSGKVLIWTEAELTAAAAPGLRTPLTLGGSNLQNLALSAYSKHGYAVGPGGNAIHVVNTAGGGSVDSDITILPIGAKPALVAVTPGAGTEFLAVAGEDKTFYLVRLSPTPTLTGNVALAHKPVGLVISPGGRWAYVLENNNDKSFVQVVDLYDLQQGLPTVATTPMQVGNDSRQIVASADGKVLYIPFLGVIENTFDGGVAKIEVEEGACEEILWRHLDGCSHCDTPNCVVLATIENYHVGDKIESQPSTPSAPPEGSAYIDNRKGRQLLPSTQVLKELIECVMQQGPGGAPKQGPPGLPGHDGLGIDAVKATIVACNATLSPAQIQTIGGQRTLVLEVPRGCDGTNGDKGDPGIDDVNLTIVSCDTPESAEIVTDATTGKRILELVIPTNCDTNLTHICAINWVHPISTDKPISDSQNATLLNDLEKGVLIAFDRFVQNGDIHRYSFLLLQRSQPDGRDAGCWCEVPTKRVGGVKFSTECTTEEDFDALDEPDAMVNGAQLLPEERLEPDREYRVVLKGDFIRDEKGKGIDANHLPPWLPKRRSGDGTEGGTFESWFFIKRG